MKRLITLMLALAGVSCGDSVEPEPPVAVRVTVSPDSSLVEAPASVELEAKVYDQYDSLMKMDVDWSSSDTSIATVTGGGRVTAMSAGEVTITAQAGDANGLAKVYIALGPRGILHALYESLNGDDWRNNRHWLTDAPLGSWHGLKVNGDGDVTAIILNQNNLSGTIPPEIGLLDSLTLLNFSENDIGGSIPPEVGHLMALTEIRLPQNRLTGSLPESLADPPNLWGIDLQRNELTGAIPGTWLDHENLSGMLLDENQLSGPLPPAGNAPAMRVFSVSQNNITGQVPPSYGDVDWVVLNFSVNKLEGELPREMMKTSPTIFSWHTNDTLCSPAEDDFREWLDSIPFPENGPECESDGP